MRPDLPRPATRPAVSGSAAEEARPLAATGDATARRRDEGATKRQASASRLLGAVTRHLQEDVDDELRAGDQAGDGGPSVAPSAAPAENGASPAGRVAGAGSGKARRAVRRAGAAGRRSTAATEDVWSQGTEAAEASASVAGPQVRIQRHRPISRVEAIQPDAGTTPHASGRRRIASWGALLAAVVALGVLMAAGWFERLTNAEGNGPEQRQEAAGNAEPR
ncbi:hypothetical protein [Roseateles amylovorans]|uniref:Uncharacterized protein n=1 Tax=Roseateles amylovorans TaxID=2978473 RepID=A0ABY6B444_9BURK|nr:hypothetical protein [Roseateles amylovorans]UXH78303.1 hypothetical protein N4261_25700 [Roseateles amylovorans]